MTRARSRDASRGAAAPRPQRREAATAAGASAARVLRFLAAGIAVVLALRVLATFVPTSWLWGLDSLAERPAGWKLAGLALLALALWPPAAERLGGALARLTELAWPGRLAISIACAVPFFLFRCKNLLLGDTQLNVRALSKKIELSGTAQREPGALTIVSWFHRHVGAPLHLESGVSYAIVSVAFGVLYVYLAFEIARRLGRSAGERAVVLAGVLGLGSLQVFFGYPENYFFVNALGLLYLVLAVRWTEGRGRLVYAGAALGFATFIHTMAAFLVPSFLYLLYLGWRRGKKAEAAAAAGAALALLVLPLVLIGYPFDELVRVSKQEDHFLPPLSKGARSPAYAVHSWVHVTELLNESLIVAPALLAMALALWARRREAGRAAGSAARRVVAIAAAGLALFALVANPILGMSRDWDVLTFTFALVSLAAAAQLVAVPLSPRALRRIAGAVAITGIVHLGLWVAHNQTPKAARMRFRRIGANEKLFGTMWNAELWRYLGSVHAQSGELALSRDAYLHAIKTYPVEPMTYRLLAEVQYSVAAWQARQQRRPPTPLLRAALDEYYKTVLPVTTKPAFMYLGAGYAGVQVAGAESLVVEAFRRAVEADPEDLEAGAAWGDVLRNKGRLDEAEAEYRRVLAKQSNQVRALMGLVLIDGARGAPRDEITRRVQELREEFAWSTCVQHMQNLLWLPRGGLNTPREFEGFLCFK